MPEPASADKAAAGATTTAPATAAGKSQATLLLQQEREKRRIVLQDANLRIWESGPTNPPKGALDSNLKKNTAFVKRIKQGIGADAKEQVIKELATLNVEKYLEEIQQVLPEGMSKCTTAKDSFAGVEVRQCAPEAATSTPR